MSDLSELEKILCSLFEGTGVTVIRIDEDGRHTLYAPAEEGLPLDEETWLAVEQERFRLCNWYLVDERSGDEMPFGETLRSLGEDDEYILIGGAPPHKPSSTGRVYVRRPDAEPHRSREFFPGVFDLKWEYRNES